MKILVTGAAGFIGSHVFNELKSRKFNVYGIDNLSRGRLNNINNKKNFFKIDLNNNKAVKFFLKKHGPFKTIIHQATLINENIEKEDIHKDIKINILSTLNLIKNSYELGTKKIIFASSIAVYGKIKKKQVNELDNLSPLSSYAISKLTIENYIKYISNFKFKNLKFVILRYSNVYGPKQSNLGEVGVIRKFIVDLKNNRSITKHGNGTQSRDFIYIKDVVEATIKSIKLDKNIILNISSGKSTSVNQIINILKKIFKFQFRIKKKGFHKSEYFYFKASNMLACKKLKWTPKTGIKSGILQTAQSN